MIRIGSILLIGLIVSLYALWVKKKLSLDPSYRPLCDISKRISCSRPLQGPYGALFGITNVTLGILFYSVMLFITFFFPFPFLLQAGAAIAFVGSCFLAYILFFRLKTVCLICTIIYMINVIFFFCIFFMKYATIF